MKPNLRMLALVLVVGMGLLLTACGGGGGGQTGGGQTGGGGAPAPVTLQIGSDGENLAFDKKELTVQAGQQVTLEFKNNSVAQQHNWVLIKGDDTVAAQIANDGLVAGLEKAYLPEDQSNIIAHTGVVEPQASASITFTAPAAGTYLYICTIPGHYPLMQGKLIVK
ncbi:MAG: plastocyanin/azurin family copper-binding protein [Oscillochloridaceae bacterium]|nr:plastocyanin/azurin family copper-binding protein [Chloroflexaceae bacterium]MDW8391443.1 plastocyanin/azurin family copper-binding protein [Oscillochloridaceae bacterium]